MFQNMEGRTLTAQAITLNKVGTTLFIMSCDFLTCKKWFITRYLDLNYDSYECYLTQAAKPF